METVKQDLVENAQTDTLSVSPTPRATVLPAPPWRPSGIPRLQELAMNVETGAAPPGPSLL